MAPGDEGWASIYLILSTFSTQGFVFRTGIAFTVLSHISQSLVPHLPKFFIFQQPDFRSWEVFLRMMNSCRPTATHPEIYQLMLSYFLPMLAPVHVYIGVHQHCKCCPLIALSAFPILVLWHCFGFGKDPDLSH